MKNRPVYEDFKLRLDKVVHSCITLEQLKCAKIYCYRLIDKCDNNIIHISTCKDLVNSHIDLRKARLYIKKELLELLEKYGYQMTTVRRSNINNSIAFIDKGVLR